MKSKVNAYWNTVLDFPDGLAGLCLVRLDSIDLNPNPEVFLEAGSFFVDSLEEPGEEFSRDAEDCCVLVCFAVSVSCRESFEWSRDGLRGSAVSK